MSVDRARHAAAPNLDRIARGMASIQRLLRRHWLFAIFLAVGLVLRVITWLAYQPAMLYIDSFRYIANLETMAMNGLNPIGYHVILRVLLNVGALFGVGLALTAAVQHLLGLAVAVVLYRIARGLGAVRWVSALVTLPVLTDAYRLQIEQNLMAEAWSDAILVGALWLLLAWRLLPGPFDKLRARDEQLGERGDRLGERVGLGPLPWQAAAAGALIAAAFSIRVISIVVIIPFVAYLIFAGARWRDRSWWRPMIIRLCAGLAGFGLIFGSYLVAFRLTSGEWGASGATGSVLYGRAATVADCDKLPLDEYLKQLCPSEPLGQRKGVDYYTHHANLQPATFPPGVGLADLRRDFGVLVLREQPLDIVWAVLKDFGKGFVWGRETSLNDVPLERWHFQIEYQRWEYTNAEEITQRYDGTNPKVITPLTTFLRGYQLTIGYTPGALLGLAGLLGVAAVFSRRGGLRAEAMLVVGIPLVLLGGAAGFEFSWRYQLPGLVFFPLAAAIGYAALFQRTRADDSRNFPSAG
jgi:hypothetical protein